MSVSLMLNVTSKLVPHFQTVFSVCLCGGRKKGSPPQRQMEKSSQAMRGYI